MYVVTWRLFALNKGGGGHTESDRSSNRGLNVSWLLPFFWVPAVLRVHPSNCQIPEAT